MKTAFTLDFVAMHNHQQKLISEDYIQLYGREKVSTPAATLCCPRFIARIHYFFLCLLVWTQSHGIHRSGMYVQERDRERVSEKK